MFCWGNNYIFEIFLIILKALVNSFERWMIFWYVYIKPNLRFPNCLLVVFKMLDFIQKVLSPPFPFASSVVCAGARMRNHRRTFHACFVMPKPNHVWSVPLNYSILNRGTQAVDRVVTGPWVVLYNANEATLSSNTKQRHNIYKLALSSCYSSNLVPYRIIFFLSSDIINHSTMKTNTRQQLFRSDR